MGESILPPYGAERGRGDLSGARRRRVRARGSSVGERRRRRQAEGEAAGAAEEEAARAGGGYGCAGGRGRPRRLRRRWPPRAGEGEHGAWVRLTAASGVPCPVPCFYSPSRSPPTSNGGTSRRWHCSSPLTVSSSPPMPGGCASALTTSRRRCSSSPTHAHVQKHQKRCKYLVEMLITQAEITK